MKEYNESELYLLDYNQLKNLFLEVRSKIITAKNKKKDCVDLEIYFCYIQKVLQEKDNI